MIDYRREIVIMRARSVAHLYALAAALISRRERDPAELVRVLDMLQRACGQLTPMPDCAASVLEQCREIRSVQANTLDDAQTAMALTRAGLVINAWCTAPTMLVSTQATDGPQSIGELLHTLGTLHPDPRYQAAVAEQLAVMAHERSAARQLGACYFQAHEAYSLLEIHRLLSKGDTSHAADLLDNASRGALTAARFLEGEPLAARHNDTTDEAKADHSEGAQAEAIDEADAPEADHDSDGAQVEAGEADAGTDHAHVSGSATERPDAGQSATTAARDPPAFAEASLTHQAQAGPNRCAYTRSGVECSPASSRRSKIGGSHGQSIASHDRPGGRRSPARQHQDDLRSRQEKRHPMPQNGT